MHVVLGKEAGMRWIRRSALSWTLSALLPVMPLHSAGVPAQAPAAGVVAEAERARVGNGPVTAGASVYGGDVISTESEGHAQVRIGKTQFQLQGDTQVALFSGANGAVAELRRGTLVVSHTSPTEGFEIYASDVRIVPTSDRPILGEVTLNSPCDVKITSEHGKLEATVGKEKKTIEDGHSYDVRPDFTVDDSRVPAISPDDSNYHRGHRHTTCAVAATHGAHAPVAAASSHFAIGVGVGIGVITVIGIKKGLESPDRP
jgi:hypothetical protein